MRRCQVFNIFAGVSVPSFAVKPGMLFLRWFVRKGSIAWVPWSISFTFVACSVHGESATFLTPAAGERHGGVSLAPHDPRHCAENGRYAVCSTPASSGGPGRTRRPCLDRSSDHRPGGQSWMCACVPARSPVAQETVACGTSRERNIPQNTCPEVRKLLSRQPPFTGIALVHDKQKKAGHLKWPA